jgi:hypothetical protein
MSLLSVLTAAGTPVTDTTAETSMGGYTFPANFWQAGKVVKFSGFVRTTASDSTDTLLVKVKIGSTTLITTAAVDVADGDVCAFSGVLACRNNPGATSTIVAQGFYGPADASGTALRIRSRDFDARCVRFAKGLRAFEERALSIAARILNRDPSVVLTYPKRFVQPDPGQDLARALLLVQGLGQSMGAEAFSEAMRQALDAALSLTPERLAEIVEAARAMPQGPAVVADVAPDTEAAPVAPEGDTTVQDQVLNGAQVSSLVEIVTAVSTGQLPRDAAVQIVMLAYQVDDATAQRILGTAGRGFVATAPAAGVQGG